MPTNLLLSTTTSIWEQLKERSGVPNDFFSGNEPEELRPDALPPCAFVGEMPEAPENLSVEELERIDNLLFSASDGSFVWLHYCKGTPEEEFQSIRQASQAWRKLVEERKRRHQVRIRPICILIGGDSNLDGEHSFRELLAHLDSSAGDLAFRSFYVMSPRLEPAGKQIFHSRTVWQVSVARLLLFLSAKERDNSASHRFYAWRFYEFRYSDPELLYQILLPACADALLNELGKTDSSVQLPSEKGAWKVAEFPKEKASTSPFWFLPDVEKDSQKASEESALWNQLHEISEMDDKVRIEDQIDFLERREKSLREFWNALHENPGCAWKGKEKVRSIDYDSLRNKLEQAGKNVSLSQEGLQQMEFSKDAMLCAAKEFSKAQAWFLQRWFRLALCLACGSLSGILFYRYALLQFGHPALALLVASGAFLGGFLAATITYLLENWRGEKGLAEWQKRFDEYQNAVADFHKNLTGLKQAAAALSGTSLNATTNSRLFRSLSRLVNTVSHAFRWSASREIVGVSDNSASNSPILRYLEQSTRKIEAKKKPDAQDSREELTKYAVNHLIKESELMELLRKHWKDVSKLSDCSSSGAIRIADLHAKIKDALVGLPSKIDALMAGDGVDKAFLEAITTAVSYEASDLFSLEHSDAASISIESHLLLSAKEMKSLVFGEEKPCPSILSLPNAVDGLVSCLLLQLDPIEKVTAAGGERSNLTSLPAKMEVSP